MIPYCRINFPIIIRIVHTAFVLEMKINCQLSSPPECFVVHCSLPCQRQMPPCPTHVVNTCLCVCVWVSAEVTSSKWPMHRRNGVRVTWPERMRSRLQLNLAPSRQVRFVSGTPSDIQPQYNVMHRRVTSSCNAHTLCKLKHTFFSFYPLVTLSVAKYSTFASIIVWYLELGNKE